MSALIFMNWLSINKIVENGWENALFKFGRYLSNFPFAEGSFIKNEWTNFFDSLFA